MVVPPKHPKMIIFSRKIHWLLGTTILGNPHRIIYRMSQEVGRWSGTGSKPTEKNGRIIAQLLQTIYTIVGGFNPSEKYESKWECSPNRNENQKYLKPPPSSSMEHGNPIGHHKNFIFLLKNWPCRTQSSLERCEFHIPMSTEISLSKASWLNPCFWARHVRGK